MTWRLTIRERGILGAIKYRTKHRIVYIIVNKLYSNELWRKIYHHFYV